MGQQFLLGDTGKAQLGGAGGGYRSLRFGGGARSGRVGLYIICGMVRIKALQVSNTYILA